jgi:hypothetical protein
MLSLESVHTRLDRPSLGYALALVVEACIHHQADTAHKDIIHVTAQFLQSTSVAPFEVSVLTIKKGRGFSNIIADLVQNVSLSFYVCKLLNLRYIRVKPELLRTLYLEHSQWIHPPMITLDSRRNMLVASPFILIHPLRVSIG